MTTFETVSTFFLGTTFLISCYSIMSAFAAKRSAEAAETQAIAAVSQARHAETQANAAETQARSAEKQVDIMLQQLAVDHIAGAIRSRRAAYDCKEAVTSFFNAVMNPVSNHFGEANRKLMACADALEDIPPVFPKNVRALVFSYLVDLRRDQMGLVTTTGTAERNAILNHFNRSADTVIAAMDVAISDSIQRLSE